MRNRKKGGMLLQPAAPRPALPLQIRTPTAPTPAGSSSAPVSKPARSKTGQPVYGTQNQHMATSLCQAGKPFPTGQNMCTGCDGKCCRLAVDLTVYDIARIILNENKEPGEFVVLCEAQGQQGDRTDQDAGSGARGGSDVGTGRTDTTACLGFRANGKLLRFLLKQADDERGCIFHNDKMRYGCTIEPYKPAICIDYPFSLCYEVPVLRSDAICPKENKVRARTCHPKITGQTLADSSWEWERYAEMMEDWNKHAKGNETPEEFLAFAIKEAELEMTPWGSAYRKIKRKIGLL